MKTVILTLIATALWAQTVVNGSRVITGTVNYCADAGSNDTYACTITGLTAYGTGTEYSIKANTANTDAATVNISSIGAITIKKREGGITTDLATNDIRAGQIIHFTYDGTNMQCSDCNGNASSGGSSLTSNAGDSPWFPTVSLGVNVANRAMGAGQFTCDPFITQVSMQFRKMRFYLQTVSAAGTGIRGLIMTRASDGSLSMIAETSGILTDSGGGAFKDLTFSGGSAVSGGVLTLPAAQNYRICVVNDGAPTITQTGNASDAGTLLLFNGWDGGAYTTKNIVHGTAGVTGTGVNVNVTSPITAANQTASSGRGVLVLALIP